MISVMNGDSKTGPVPPRNPAFRRFAVESKTSPEDGRYLNAVEVGDGVVRAYWRENEVVRFKHYAVPPSFFVRRSELDREPALKRALANTRHIRKVSSEGSYYRITCDHYGTRKRLAAKTLETKYKGPRDMTPDLEGPLWAKGVEPLEADVRPVRRWSIDHKAKVQRGKRVYLDIETDSRVPMSQKEESRLLCWALVDDETGERVTGLLNEDTDADEARLLTELFNELARYDQVCAWSGDWFDFPVILARSDEHHMRIDWARWLWLDHLELYKRMIASAAVMTGERKQSMALERVAFYECGEGKTKGDSGEALGARTWEMWANGERDLLVAYCADDADLLRKIEKKTGYLELFQSICDSTGVFADTHGIKPSAYVESYMMHLGLERDYRFPTCYWSKNDENEQFDGAMVLQPERGVLRDVHVCDFAGLYPSIIMTWNMSIETLRTEKASGMSLFQPLYLSHLEPKDDGKAKVPDGCALAALTDQVFAQEPPGILAVACEELGRLRKFWTKQKDKAVPNSPEYFDADRRATAYKVARNSFYGIVGAPSSRFFKREVAESVSQQGVWLFREVARVLESRNIRVIYGDTDGLYGAGCTRTEFGDAVKFFNEVELPRLLRERGCTRNFISLEHEKGYDRIVFTAKKRYVGSWSYYKGVAAKADSEPEIKGLEFKRGDALKLERDLQQEVAYMLVGFGRPACEDSEEFKALVRRWRERIKSSELQPEDVTCAVKLSSSVTSGISTPPAKKQPKTLKDAVGKWVRLFVRVDQDKKKESNRRAVFEGTVIRFDREIVVFRTIQGEEKQASLGEFEMVVHEAEQAHVYVARMVRARGRDVSKGTKVEYYVSTEGPRPIADFDNAKVDRVHLWDDVWRSTCRLLEAAFPGDNWGEFKFIDGARAPGSTSSHTSNRRSAPKPKDIPNQLSLFDLVR